MVVNENGDAVVVNENANMINCYALGTNVDDKVVNMHVINENDAVVNLVSVTLVILLKI